MLISFQHNLVVLLKSPIFVSLLKQSKTKIGRNLVDYEAGKVILDTAMGIEKKMNIKQVSLLD